MGFNATKLANGLSIVTYKLPMVKTVALNLIVKVGSRFEESNEDGISHFLEHMAFKGTSTRNSKEIAEEFDSIGGHFNAYTSKEQTVYYAKVLGEHLEKALAIIADILQNSLFNEEDIEKEYNVICQEIFQVQDNPDDLAYENLMAKAYYGQNLGKSILGTPESIKGFSADSFRAFMQKHYTANNMILSAAGDVDHQSIVLLAEKLLNNLSNKEVKTANKSTYTGGYSIIQKDLEQSFILLGFNSCSYLELKDFYHTQMLSLILGGGFSSRLFQKIREHKGLAYSVGSFNNAFMDNGLFSLYAGCAHEKVEEVAFSMIEEAKNICKELSDNELARAKAQIKASVLMAEEKTSYKSEEAGKNYALFGRQIPIEEVLSAIEATTNNDITGIAQKIFSSKLTLSLVGSKAANVDYNQLSDYLHG